MDDPRGRIARYLAKLQTLWSIVGITLFWILLLELAAGALLATRAPIPLSANASAYPDEPWVEGFVRETIESAPVAWAPYVYWRRPPFAGDHINVDPEGRRVTWHPPDKRTVEPALTVFLFGGSAMWGSGSRDEHTIPSELSRRLAGRGIDAEVVNFGEMGYVSTQEIVSLLLQLRGGARPDMVLFYDGVNDLFSTFQNGVAGWPQNEDHRQREFNLLASRRRLLGATLEVAYARSAIGRTLATFSSGGAPPDPQATSEAILRSTLETYRANVLLAEALGRHRGFETAFYWQPAVFTKTHLTEFERQEQERFDFLAPLYRELSQRVGADEGLGAVEGFLDLSQMFADDPEQRFVDFCHTTESANSRIARAIFEHLERLEWLAPAVPGL